MRVEVAELDEKSLPELASKYARYIVMAIDAPEGARRDRRQTLAEELRCLPICPVRHLTLASLNAARAVSNAAL
jgi:hypothetical protein